MAQKEAFLKKLETLEGARKRSSQAAYNASQFEGRMTKQFFSQFKFKGGFSNTNTDINTLHSIPDWDSPDVRGDDVLAEDTKIVDEFARYYTHLSRPKPSANSETLSKALEAKGLSDADSLKLEAPLSLAEILKAMFSMARGKSPGPDGLRAELYHMLSGH
jgi:hypothetical protein